MQSCKGRRYKTTANNDNQIARFSSFHIQKCSASVCYFHHPLYIHMVLTLPPSKVAKTPPTFPSTVRMWTGAPIPEWELKTSMFAPLRAVLSSHPRFLFQQPPAHEEGDGREPLGSTCCAVGTHWTLAAALPFYLFFFFYYLQFYLIFYHGFLIAVALLKP